MGSVLTMPERIGGRPKVAGIGVSITELMKTISGKNSLELFGESKKCISHHDELHGEDSVVWRIPSV